MALCAGDRADARAHLEAAASVFGGIETTHQEGWALAVLAAICAEDGEAATARRWLDRASRHFELLGGDAGIAYCRELEAKTLQRLKGVLRGKVVSLAVRRQVVETRRQTTELRRSRAWQRKECLERQR